MIIIALYLNIHSLSLYDAEVLINEQVRKLNDNNPHNVVYHCFGVKNGDTRMEVVYPPSIDANLILEEITKLTI